jgi:8-oxo-dGTP diphosphatase
VGSGDGNGWVECRCGHRHWGRYGAAGLMLARPGGPDAEVLLQLRAEWTHQGGTWGLPGGATDSHEEPTDGALREAWEETGVEPASVDVVATRVSADHGDWRYTVVIARARGPVSARPANAESTAVRWVPRLAVGDLPLHPGLARTWPELAEQVARLRW